MAARGFGALLLTTRSDIAHFTGFRTEFFESPTRPWFVVLPSHGEPVAVVPAIGEPLMRRTGLADIRTWPSPRPADEGVSLLGDTLAEIVGEGGPVALPMHPGTSLAMPLGDWLRLRDRFDWRGDDGLVAGLRTVKSEAEIDAIRAICACASRAFGRLPERAGAGMGLDEVFRRFRILLLEEGADGVPYLAGAAGPDGYEDVISPADERPLMRGDVMMLDTGATKAGWFCDFDRNFTVGAPSKSACDAYARLVEAVHAAADIARPGVRACDVHAAMERVCGPSFGGRLGHGLGLQLTEPPSLAAFDETALRPGMVLTFEPVVTCGPGRIMVHEENVVVRENGVEWLTGPPAEQLGRLE